VNVFHFLGISLSASQSAVEKSRLPEKAPLSSARIDAKEVAQSLVSQRLCGFSLIDSIAGEMVTGKQGNMIAGPAPAGSLKKIQAVSTKRKARRREQKVGTRCSSF
jgi:hypothetical protein